MQHQILFIYVTIITINFHNCCILAKLRTRTILPIAGVTNKLGSLLDPLLMFYFAGRWQAAEQYGASSGFSMSQMAHEHASG